MKKADRIMPDRVAAAYEKTGLTPTRGAYFAPSRICPGQACGIGVCLAEIEEYRVGEGRFINKRLSALNITASYHSGFVDGFDGEDFDPSIVKNPRVALIGYQDGKAAAARVFAVSPVS